jgi:hypothetical protein
MSRKNRGATALRARLHVPKRSVVRETETVPSDIHELSLPEKDPKDLLNLSDKQLRAMSPAQFDKLLQMAHLISQAARTAREAAGEDGSSVVATPSNGAPMDDEGPYVSLETETYDQGGEAIPVYGAVSARMWLGDPGASLLASFTIAIWKPVPLARQQEEMVGLERGLLLELQKQISDQTGLIFNLHYLSACVEWLWGWRCDGTLLQRARMFAAGRLKSAVTARPSEMTLQDVRTLAREWAQGAGAELGLQEPLTVPGAVPVPVSVERFRRDWEEMAHGQDARSDP